MADYLPLLVTKINHVVDQTTGERRISAAVSTIQPEKFNLNLTKLDADRLQSFMQAEGKILMVPIRRGEMNGRAYTSVADGYILPADNIQATFDLKVGNQTITKQDDSKPVPSNVQKPAVAA